jgi:hypothetical protein
MSESFEMDNWASSQFKSISIHHLFGNDHVVMFMKTRSTRGEDISGTSVDAVLFAGVYRILSFSNDYVYQVLQ